MKKLYILAILGMMAVLAACSSNEVYQEHRDAALLAIEEERYEDARKDLEAAYAENEEEEVLTTMEDVEQMILAHEAYTEANFEATTAAFEQIEASESSSEETALLQEQAAGFSEEFTLVAEHFKQLTTLLGEVEALHEEETYEEALTLIEAYEAPEVEHGVFAELLEDLQEWQEVLEEAVNEAVVEEEEEIAAAETEENTSSNDEVAADSSNESSSEQSTETETPKENESTNDTNSPSASDGDTAGSVNEGTELMTPEGELTLEDAAELVRNHTGLDNNNCQIQFDHEDDARNWVFRVFEITITDESTNEGHTSTGGWYAVNPNSGNVSEVYN